MVCYSHLFQNFPQFTVIHTVKGFGIVKKAEVDVFLELLCFFSDPMDVGNLISGSSENQRNVPPPQIIVMTFFRKDTLLPSAGNMP